VQLPNLFAKLSVRNKQLLLFLQQLALFAEEGLAMSGLLLVTLAVVVYSLGLKVFERGPLDPLGGAFGRRVCHALHRITINDMVIN
jgi:hypothetical protein